MGCVYSRRRRCELCNECNERGRNNTVGNMFNSFGLCVSVTTSHSFCFMVCFSLFH